MDVSVWNMSPPGCAYLEVFWFRKIVEVGRVFARQLSDEVGERRYLNSNEDMLAIWLFYFYFKKTTTECR